MENLDEFVTLEALASLDLVGRRGKLVSLEGDEKLLLFARRVGSEVVDSVAVDGESKDTRAKGKVLVDDKRVGSRVRSNPKEVVDLVLGDEGDLGGSVLAALDTVVLDTIEASERVAGGLALSAEDGSSGTERVVASLAGVDGDLLSSSEDLEPKTFDALEAKAAVVDERGLVAEKSGVGVVEVAVLVDEGGTLASRLLADLSAVLVLEVSSLRDDSSPTLGVDVAPRASLDVRGVASAGASVRKVVGAVAEEPELIDRVKGLVEDDVVDAKVDVGSAERERDLELPEVGRVSSGRQRDVGDEELVELGIIGWDKVDGVGDTSISVDLGDRDGGDELDDGRVGVSRNARDNNVSGDGGKDGDSGAGVLETAESSLRVKVRNVRAERLFVRGLDLSLDRTHVVRDSVRVVADDAADFSRLVGACRTRLLGDSIVNVIIEAVEVPLTVSIRGDALLHRARKILFERLFVGVLLIKEIVDS